jgi:hypothetical protein
VSDFERMKLVRPRRPDDADSGAPAGDIHYTFSCSNVLAPRAQKHGLERRLTTNFSVAMG